LQPYPGYQFVGDPHLGSAGRTVSGAERRF
ncbi:ABC transporter substrate-binding protein, partial [Klebsiella variicola]